MFKLTTRTGWIAAGIAVTLAASSFAACGDETDKDDQRAGPKKLSSTELVALARPAMVKLSGKFGDGVAAGSGVVIDAKRGLVLTNAHVVAGVSALTAQVGDTAATTPARVVATAPCEDVALVELPERPAGMKALKLGPSSGIKAGAHVSVFGYPATLESTDTGSSSKLVFTDGTVSNPATSAEIGAGSPRYPELIQHQAPVNHGNSGGPLVDDYGRVVGINTLGGGGDSQGQYYAISIDRIKRTLLPELQAGRSIANIGWTLAPISSDLIYRFYDEYTAGTVIDLLNYHSDDKGLMVLNAEPGSAAEGSHFGLGDYVTAIDGTPVSSQADVCAIMQSKTPDSALRVEGRLLAPGLGPDDFGATFTQDIRVPVS